MIRAIDRRHRRIGRVPSLAGSDGDDRNTGAMIMEPSFRINPAFLDTRCPRSGCVTSIMVETLEPSLI